MSPAERIQTIVDKYLQRAAGLDGTVRSVRAILREAGHGEKSLGAAAFQTIVLRPMSNAEYRRLDALLVALEEGP